MIGVLNIDTEHRVVTKDWRLGFTYITLYVDTKFSFHLMTGEYNWSLINVAAGQNGVDAPIVISVHTDDMEEHSKKVDV